MQGASDLVLSGRICIQHQQKWAWKQKNHHHSKHHVAMIAVVKGTSARTLSSPWNWKITIESFCRCKTLGSPPEKVFTFDDQFLTTNSYTILFSMSKNEICCLCLASRLSASNHMVLCPHRVIITGLQWMFLQFCFRLRLANRELIIARNFLQLILASK